MKKVKKGSYGYLKYAKKKQLLITAVLFAIPLIIFFSGLIYTKTRLNILTFVAILGCLPACKAMVTLIMLFMQKSVSQQVYDSASNASGELIAGYDLIFTAYEHTTPINALTICGNHLVCYTPDEKVELPFLEKHISRILTGNGYSSVQVKVMKDLKKYCQRVTELNKNREHYREDIPFTPDERYPDLSREELIFHTLLAISL